METEDLSKNLEIQAYVGESQPVICLKNCSPIGSLQPSTPIVASNKIRRSRRDEPFTTVAEPVHIASLINRQHDVWGNTTGEDYFPVIRHLQKQLELSIRTIAFHPCVTSTGHTFIYPQKLDPPNTWANPWNASLAQALSLPHGQWRTVGSDKTAQCYHYELVMLPMVTNPQYPSFQEDLELALRPNIISSLDHLVVQKILAEQHSASDLGEIY